MSNRVIVPDSYFRFQIPNLKEILFTDKDRVKLFKL